METRIKIGLQKKGRLADDCFKLLENCGLKLAKSKDQLFCRIKEMPIDILLLRDDDIPELMNQGECDLGIVGRNLVNELEEASDMALNISEIMPLGFSRCRLCIAVPKGSVFKELSDLNGLKIATSYPALLAKYLAENNVQATPVHLSGAVEIAPRLEIADAICDLVSSGATLAANNLENVATVLQSEALLLRRKGEMSAEKEAIIARLVDRINGVTRARSSKYIMLNAPREAIASICDLLPGAGKPTIMDLQDPNMVAIHAVCQENVFWDTMEKLRQAGGSAILVMPIEKMLD